MEREEPKFSKPDMHDMQFRPRSYRGPSYKGSSTVGESDIWLKVAGGLVIVVLIAMGLIEWNAKRQAVAMTAELLRPMTPAEEARFKEQQRRWEKEMEAEAAKDLAEVRRQIREVNYPQQPQYVPPAPLQPGQRCIQGRRFERIEGGWRNLPYQPC